MKYFRVIYGYGKDDFFSIEESDLLRAMRAQVHGTIFACDEGTRAGNDIKGIQPDYNRILGVNRDHQLTGEDYRLLGSQVVKDHRMAIQGAKIEVANKRLPNGRPMLAKGNGG